LNTVDITKLSRRQLIIHFEIERQEWLLLGMSEADIFSIHFGNIYENGRGGDYRIWLDERKHIRSDHKYTPGTTVAISDIDPKGVWIGDDRRILDEVDVMIDLNSVLKSLTSKQKYCFEEIVLKGRTQSDVAQDLGIGQPKVNKHLHNAKSKILKFFLL